MRRIFLSLLVTAAVSVFSVKAQDEDSDKVKVKGSGNVVTNEISVQSFDQLAVSGVFSVSLSQGSKEEVKIEADDNLQSYFEVKNDGSKLVVSMKKDVSISSKTKMKVYITFKKLKSMDLRTVGNISSEQSLSFDDLKLKNQSVGSVDLKLTARSVDINNQSVGDTRLSGKAENVVIKNESVGSIRAADFVVQKLEIENDGVGSAEVNAEKEIKVKDSFLGKVRNKGAATIKRSERVRI